MSTISAADLAALDWPGLAAALDATGAATVPRLLDPEQCAAIVDLYDRPGTFRNIVTMARHNFGRGEYGYFADPLPEIVETLRRGLFPGLAAIANRWAARLGETARFPDTLEAFLARCHGAGQNRPTPLLVRYGEGDYNCLHQDLYGDHVFPLQAAILLAEPGRDFTGGEFLLTEQRPRMQSRAEVVPLAQGDAVLFPARHRPVAGARGDFRATLRHGVSRVRSGRRHTLGIIFHDAA
jgi:hypothetical protein